MSPWAIHHSIDFTDVGDEFSVLSLKPVLMREVSLLSLKPAMMREVSLLSLKLVLMRVSDRKSRACLKREVSGPLSRELVLMRFAVSRELALLREVSWSWVEKLS